MTLFTKRHGRTVGLALALAIVPLLSACESDPVTDVTPDRGCLDPNDRDPSPCPVLEMLLAPGDAVLPGGSLALEGVRVTNFDLTVPDAFDRATGLTYALATDCCYIWGHEDVLGSETDPRLPALGSEDPRVVDNGGSGEDLYLLDPAYWWGAAAFPSLWDLWGGISDLPADTKVYVGLARYGVQPNGRLDQADILLTSEAAAPDQLVLAGGTPGGEGERPAGAFTGAPGWPYPAAPNANPWVLGNVTTNADGNAGIDVLFSSNDENGNLVYYTGQNGTETDKLLISPNENGTARSNQYNYLVIWADNPLTNPNAQVLARVQLGADLEGTSLNVQNNAFAPFPTEQVDLGTFRDLPGGGSAFAAPAQVVLNLSGLPALSGATYGLWLFNEETGTFQSAGTIDSPGADEELEVTLGDDEDIDFGAFNSVVVSIEQGAPGASPSAAQILWKQYLTPELALESGALAFGSFRTGEARAFQISGAGEGQFIGDSLIVRLDRLTPPPTGFHYQSYMLSLSPTGEVSAQQRLHAITLDELGNARDAVAEDEVGGFANFNTYVVVLEPDVSPSLTPALIQVSENWLDKFADFFVRPEG